MTYHTYSNNRNHSIVYTCNVGSKILMQKTMQLNSPSNIGLYTDFLTFGHGLVSIRVRASTISKPMITN